MNIIILYVVFFIVGTSIGIVAWGIVCKYLLFPFLDWVTDP